MKPTIPQLQQKLSLLQQLFVLVQRQRANKNFFFYQFCLKYLGVDASPRDLADDMVGCAETVTNLLNHYIGFPIILGTATLYENLARNRRFAPILVPEPGCIIISPTGYGNGTMQGHVGVVGVNGQILSNDSYTGKFSANYTIANWTERYKKQGGMPIYYFKLI